jgi:hypothetical protein
VIHKLKSTLKELNLNAVRAALQYLQGKVFIFSGLPKGSSYSLGLNDEISLEIH